MHRNLIVAGTITTGAIGYGIACWLAKMTVEAERIDRDRDVEEAAARARRNPTLPV
jgi:hypothetical protein